MGLYRSVFKPFFDFIGAFILLVFLSPVILMISIVLLIQNRGDVLFVQERPGKNEKLFKIYKFRTMNNEKDAKGEMLPDIERMTPFGRILRKTSLDELPQLINILKGDISFIGPRPLLTEYLPLYNDFQRKRHSVKPGISGWAQVNGRNAISWQEKFICDIYYVEHLSFLLDIKIFYNTILKVFKSEGINQSGQVTMGKFYGN